jgi:hypothetical protein
MFTLQTLWSKIYVTLIFCFYSGAAGTQSYKTEFGEENKIL